MEGRIHYYRENKRLTRAFLTAHRRDILIEQNFFCRYCYCPLDQKTATVDHIKPKSKGGSNNKENLLVSCEECNKSKRSMSLEDFNIRIDRSHEIEFLLLRFRRQLWIVTHKSEYRIRKAAGIKCSIPKFSKIKMSTSK